MFDQEIIQDFLTESGELLDQLDRDLVILEGTPEDPELLNRVFRALHTIKGSASFLALTNLVSVAHAAESALNAARSGSVVLHKSAMDLILGAVDVLKQQFENLKAGQDLVKADDALVSNLVAFAEGRLQADAAPTTASVVPTTASVHSVNAEAPTSTTSTISAPAASHSATPQSIERLPLKLSESKDSLIEFLIADVRETIVQAEAAAALLAGADTRPGAGSKLNELGESMSKAATFFEFDQMNSLSSALTRIGSEAPSLSDQIIDQTLPRIGAILDLLREQADGLASGTIIKRPISGLCDSVTRLLDDGTLPPEKLLNAAATHSRALIVDGVVTDESAASVLTGTPAEPDGNFASVETVQTSELKATAPAGATAPIATSSAPVAIETPAPIASTPKAQSVEASVNSQPSTKNSPAAPHPIESSSSADHPAGDKSANSAASVEQTIRVEVGRLESLLNLVGELVLQKNRLSAIARSAANEKLGSSEFNEMFSAATGNLDRVTSDLQLAVMKTRMQPLDKLFGRYPRLVRDLARKTGKDIHLNLEGGDTEVDKSVIEELGDPLVHIMRNSCDHGLETPEQRRAAGKPERGTITLRACHEGSHVKVQIIDDGRGLSRARIGKKAVERGLLTEQALAQMSDKEVQQLVFAAGFSTAEQVTDLSGRGVGMDVVRTNVEKIKGTIELESTEGVGTTISIKIPLTVAILTAMMVQIGSETYAVPLSSIVEIVKPETGVVSSIHGAQVMRLRDSVLPLIDGCAIFSLPAEKRKETPFVVVIAHGDKRVGLQVSRLVGQQEVVIKPLDERVDASRSSGASGPVSGATVRDDGGVSLIVDIARMVRIAEDTTRSRPAPVTQRRTPVLA
jgi:two-component system chemotaxis sensor kinase CheA